MLAIAIHGHQHIEVGVHRIIKSRDQGRPVAAIAGMGDNRKVRLPAEQFSGTIGGTVIDNQDILAIAPDFVQNLLEGALFIINGDGGEELHAATSWRKGKGQAILTIGARLSNDGRGFAACNNCKRDAIGRKVG